MKEEEDKTLLWKRWRMILGPDSDVEGSVHLSPVDLRRDRLLEDLLRGNQGKAGRKLHLAECMEEIDTYYKGSAAEFLKKEALQKVEIKNLLEAPYLLEQVKPSVHLISNLLAAKSLISESNKQQVREFIKRYIDTLQEQYFSKINNEVRGSLRNRLKTSKPLWKDLDWQETLKRNLKYYQKDFKTILPVNLVGSSRISSKPHNLYLLIDQSYSMAKSAIHAGILSALLASIPYLSTRVFAFDTEFVELTHYTDDPVELLMGIQLGGGTYMAPLLEFVESEIRESDASFVLMISDLQEGYSERRTFDAMQRMRDKGIAMGVFLAMDKVGKVEYNRGLAKKLMEISISVSNAPLEELKEKLVLFFQRKSFSA
jgi:uncharacterized protein with von Willebrand factor type A (vWA) domain